MPDTNVPIRKLTDELAAGDFVWWPRPDGSEVPATVEASFPCAGPGRSGEPGCWLVTNTFGGSMHVARDTAWRTATVGERLGISEPDVDPLDVLADRLDALTAKVDGLDEDVRCWADRMLATAEDLRSMLAALDVHRSFPVTPVVTVPGPDGEPLRVTTEAVAS